MSALYLVTLLLSLGAMVLLDLRFRLFFWRDARRAAIVLVTGVLFFLAWDLAGIGLGVFARGASGFMTGIVLAPQLPLEELFFLAFLCYITMNLVAAADLGWRAARARRTARTAQAPRTGRQATR